MAASKFLHMLTEHESTLVPWCWEPLDATLWTLFHAVKWFISTSHRLL